MRIALDTNAYVAFCRGEKRVVELMRRAELIALPFIVLAELRAGFARGTQSKKNERQLQIFLNSKRVEVLFADEETTHHYARLFAQLWQAGTPIPTNDLWIASVVLQQEFALLSFDQHFDHIPQLVRV
jgi:tRNA(fMet)-specific endonuclease VapC